MIDTGVIQKYNIEEIWINDEFQEKQAENIKVMREVRGQMSRFISIGSLAGEKLVRKLEIRYLPKEKFEEVSEV